MSPRWTRIVGPGTVPAEGPGVNDEAVGDGDVLVDDRHVDVVDRPCQDLRGRRIDQRVLGCVRVRHRGGRRASAGRGGAGRGGGPANHDLALHAGSGVTGDRANECEPARRDGDGAGRRFAGVSRDLRAVGEREVMQGGAGVLELDLVGAGSRHGRHRRLEAEVERLDRRSCLRGRPLAGSSSPGLRLRSRPQPERTSRLEPRRSRSRSRRGQGRPRWSGGEGSGASQFSRSLHDDRDQTHTVIVGVCLRSKDRAGCQMAPFRSAAPVTSTGPSFPGRSPAAGARSPQPRKTGPRSRLCASAFACIDHAIETRPVNPAWPQRQMVPPFPRGR